MLKNLEKDLKTCYIKGGDFTTEEVIKVFTYGKGLDIDGYKQLFDLRYVQNLKVKEVKTLMALNDHQYEKRRTSLLITLVRCALDSFEPRLKPFTSLLDLRCTFLTIAKENEYKAIQWLETSDLYKGVEVKDLCFKINYLFELIEKFKSLGLIDTVDVLETERVNLFSELYKAVGVTAEEFKKIMFD